MRPASLVASALILWGPVLLALSALVPPGQRGLGLHLVFSGALTILAVRALRILLFIPIAAPAPGRHRVVPRAPSAPVLAGAVGVAALCAAVWLAAGGHPLAALLGAALGPGALASARRSRGAPLWTGWLALHGEELVVHLPEVGYRVRLAEARVYRRERDGSVLVVEPSGRDTLLVPRAAPGRFWIDGCETLVEGISRRVPVEDVPELLSRPGPG